ncbi:unknown protein [Microcystis aeruginosa NIES-843]|uniref:Uncharacterized protein n=1 Tax=Microcystis aeruginosa (strain NIES-843 / IAM M-2473) TaxID=449447 RepID=B0JFR9_MICAN|nr:unknown protein [Microcystis aeruginosa NIES-843]
MYNSYYIKISSIERLLEKHREQRRGGAGEQRLFIFWVPLFLDSPENFLPEI